MTIVLANGINTMGRKNVDRAGHRLSANHEIIDVLLPKRNHLSARWKRNAQFDASLIYQATERVTDPIDVVAHSYGCWRALLAAERRRFRSIWLFRPALADNYDLQRIPNHPKIYCIHSKEDMAVRLGSWLPFHPFGRAGTHGMTDPAVTNLKSEGGHNADFEEPLLDEWVNMINETIGGFGQHTGENVIA